MRFIQKLRDLQGDVRGLSTVEYTVLLVLIVAGSVGLWQGFGGKLEAKLRTSDAVFGTKVTNGVVTE